MSEPVDPPSAPLPRMNAAGQARAAERQARQAEALRANLRRRKEQVRAREGQDASDTGDAPTE